MSFEEFSWRLCTGRTEPAEGEAPDPAVGRQRLQRELTDHAGVLRDAESLTAAAQVADEVLALPVGDTVGHQELRNLAIIGQASVVAALRREESRGAHTRDDFPETRPDLAHRIVFA